MIKIYSKNEMMYDMISKIKKVEMMELDYEPKKDDILCFCFDACNFHNLSSVIERFEQHQCIFVVDRSLACFFYNMLVTSNSKANIILKEEVDEQFELCYLAAKCKGMFWSSYFKNAALLQVNCDYLTTREIDLIQLLKEGYSYKEIAEITHLEYGTVRNYISRILETTNFKNKTQLALHVQKILDN